MQAFKHFNSFFIQNLPKLAISRKELAQLDQLHLVLTTSFDITIGAVDSSICTTSEDQANMPVNTSVPDEVILERGREGLRISAGGALGARDMSVGVVAQVTLRNELSRTGY